MPLRRAAVAWIATLLAAAGLVLVPGSAVAAAIANTAPGLAVTGDGVVLVGERTTVKVTAIDLDFDRVQLWAPALPDGVRLASTTSTTASFVVDGSTPGRIEFLVAAIDEHGGVGLEVVRVDVRHPHRPELLVGLGDSVASGFGLDRSDYLNRDRCWRSEGASYPRQVFEGLEAAGRFGSDAAFALLACQGARAADLGTELVGGGPADLIAAFGDEQSQLDWVVRSNPGIVTLTVGANDIRFSTPTAFVTDGALDEAALDGALAEFGHDLDTVLRTLVRNTDTTVYLTTYYDPSAERPAGVDGCSGSCFSDLVDVAVNRLNTTIADAAARQPSSRVHLIDLEPVFVGHGAPNGLGPDPIRAGRWGIVGRVLGQFTSGVHAFCSQSYTDHDTFVSSVDCVHPDADGAAAIADAVLDVALAGRPTR